MQCKLRFPCCSIWFQSVHAVCSPPWPLPAPQILTPSPPRPELWGGGGSPPRPVDFWPCLSPPREKNSFPVHPWYIHHIHRIIFTFHYTFLFNSVQHKSNLFLRKMHQLSVDGAMGGPGVVDYRKGCLIILTTIVLRDIPCISSKALSLPKCDHSYHCLIIVTTIFLRVYPPNTCRIPITIFFRKGSVISVSQQYTESLPVRC